MFLDDNWSDLKSADSEIGENRKPALFPAISVDPEDIYVEYESSKDASNYSSDSGFDRQEEIEINNKAKLENSVNVGKMSEEQIKGLEEGEMPGDVEQLDLEKSKIAAISIMFGQKSSPEGL